MNKSAFTIILLGFAMVSPNFRATGQTYATLDINNIEAGAQSNGALFNDLNGDPAFEMPRGNNTHTIFHSNLWVGATDFGGQLVSTAEVYDTYESFFPGPIADDYSLVHPDWGIVHKVLKTEVDYHIAVTTGQIIDPNYVVPPSIQNWPAHGDVSNGMEFEMAPFFDRNQDGLYVPLSGDYPLIKGDQAIWWVMNDVSGFIGISFTNMNLQVKCMLYAFDCGDPAIDNTIFGEYTFTNRGTNTFFDTYIGHWADLDIGGGADDFVGTEVQRGSVYGYNGDPFDEAAFGNKGYGDSTAAQSITILAGPKQNRDGIDNAVGIGPGESLNGQGYGDGIPDNERLGLSRSIAHTNGVGGIAAQGPPAWELDYYNLLINMWKDGSLMRFGGSGHFIDAGADTLDAKYVYPNLSDPLSWGTDGVPGNQVWSEPNAGNIPGDRRILGSVGPFDLLPETPVVMDVAYVAARDELYSTPDSAVSLLFEYIDVARQSFEDQVTPCGQGFTVAVEDIQPLMELAIYPQPAGDELTVELPTSLSGADYLLFDASGRIVQSGRLVAGANQLTLSALNGGIYLLKVNAGDQSATKRILHH